MFSLAFIVPLLVRCVTNKMDFNKLRGQLIWPVIGVLALLLGLSDAVLLFDVNFPVISISKGEATAFSLYIFLAFLFCLWPFFSYSSFNIFYMAAFGLVGGSGDPTLLLALLVASKIGPNNSFLTFIAAALMLLGEFVFLGHVQLEESRPFLHYFGLIIFVGLFFNSLRLAKFKLDKVLDLGLYTLLIGHYSDLLSVTQYVAPGMVALTLLKTFINLYGMKRFSVATSLLALFLLLFGLGGDYPKTYPLACVLFVILSLKENSISPFNKISKAPCLAFLNICGYFLFILLLLMILFNFNLYIGWMAVFGLQLTRTRVSSIAAHLKGANEPILAFSSLSLIGGYFYFLILSLNGVWSW